MKQLNDKIITWLKEKGIDKLSPNKQYLKIIEEVGELASGLLKNDLEAIKDAIGDIYIALVGFCLQLDDTIQLLNDIGTSVSVEYTLQHCVEHAYNEIKDREIKIKNGVAVKNESK